MEAKEAKRTVIFLDIDGVLQPVSSQKRFEHDREQLRRDLAARFEDPAYLDMNEYDLAAVYYDWRPTSVERLRRLCADFGAEIVVTSAWRRSSPLPVLKAFFRIHGLHHHVTDVTADTEGPPLYRAAEVKDYMEAHPEIGRFVIIDDRYRREFDQVYPDQFVHTGWHLSEDDALRARQILSGGPVTAQNRAFRPLFRSRTPPSA